LVFTISSSRAAAMFDIFEAKFDTLLRRPTTSPRKTLPEMPTFSLDLNATQQGGRLELLDRLQKHRHELFEDWE
jgi:hypothetical protein